MGGSLGVELVYHHLLLGFWSTNGTRTWEIDPIFRYFSDVVIRAKKPAVVMRISATIGTRDIPRNNFMQIGGIVYFRKRFEEHSTRGRRAGRI